jgi:hypothetical protein
MLCSFDIMTERKAEELGRLARKDSHPLLKYIRWNRQHSSNRSSPRTAGAARVEISWGERCRCRLGLSSRASRSAKTGVLKLFQCTLTSMGITNYPLMLLLAGVAGRLWKQAFKATGIQQSSTQS